MTNPDPAYDNLDTYYGKLDKIREPICKFEHEPDDDEGLAETAITIVAIIATYLTGYSNGIKELLPFLIWGTVSLLSWCWLFKISIPKDDDKGL